VFEFAGPFMRRESAATGTPQFSITGRVVKADGQPPSNVWVRVGWHEDGGVVRSVSVPVAPDGTFNAANLEPRRYILTTVRRDQQSNASAPLDAGVAVVTVGNAHVKDTVIATRPAVDVVGRIRFEGAAEGTPATVVVHARLTTPEFGSAHSIAAESQRDGTIRFRDMFGPRVIASGWSGRDASSWKPKAVLLDGRDITNTPVDFAAHPDARLEVVFIRAAPAR
jgi:hypothetical protein